MTDVLMVAAESREFVGLLSRVGKARRLRWPLQFAVAVERGNQRWILTANGPGPKLARLCVEAAAEHTGFAAMVSTGFCGGLHPSLKPKGIFVADSVWSPVEKREIPALKPRSNQLTESSAGRLLSIDRVVNSVAEKAEWCTHGLAAVDMEAFAVGEEALARHIPFFCVRVISDAAADGFLIDFNAVRDAKGRFSRARIVREALRQPFQGFRFLVSLDRECRAAADRLGDFLATCEF